MKFLLFFVTVIFALLGISEFLHILKIRLILPKGKTNTRLFINLKEETALKQITFVGEQYIWLGRKYADAVFAVGSDLSEETFIECEVIAKKYGIRMLCERKGKNGCNIGNYRKNNLSQ